MRRIIYVIVLLLMTAVQDASAYGIRFRGGVSVPINKRTSYDVFAHKRPKITGTKFSVEFDMALYSAESFGYVLRINGGGERGQAFNLFVDSRSDKIEFRLIKEGMHGLLALAFNRNELTNAHWFRAGLTFDLKHNTVSLKVKNRVKTSQYRLSDNFRPDITFGRSDYMIDVPDMDIDSVVVNVGKTYIFPLDESGGEAVHDINGTHYGHVDNPVWLINEACHWQKVATFTSPTEAGSCYDRRRNVIYYYNNKKLCTFNMLTGKTSTRTFAEPCPLKLKLAGGFIDDNDGRLYVYEVYSEEKGQVPMVASLDLNTLTWRVESRDRLKMQLHHHSTFLDKVHNRFTIFGGFGNMRYDNTFYAYDVDAGRWEALKQLKGDFICPRYFSSAGYLDSEHSVYIFGGMGNDSGDQIVGRRYLHDLYRVDLKTMRIKKLWDISDRQPNIVQVQDMIIPDKSHFYVLRYPESVSNSFMHLYRFSVKDGSHIALGDSIPIFSDKIMTNARLYYNESMGQLFVTVQETKDDIQSRFSVYTLSFPPVTLQQIEEAEHGETSPLGWIILAAALVAAGVSAAVVLRRRKPVKSTGKAKAEAENGYPQLSAEPSDSQPARVTPDTDRANSIYLFGEFSVYDRNGRNVSYMYSSLLRLVFCLILRHSDNGGISSQQLSALVWPDKPKDKVKNSRGVALNHLRKNLKELDGVELIFENGSFRFVLSQGAYCDYLRLMSIIADGRFDDHKQEFMQIVSRGKFLHFMDEPLYDGFKHDVECRMETFILTLMKDTFEAHDYEQTVSLAESEFKIDPINEKALHYAVRSYYMLKNENAAVAVFQKFVSEYKRTTGENFKRHFSYFWG